MFTRIQITKLIYEIQDAKNLGKIDARIADDCIIALEKLIAYTNFVTE